MQIIVSRWINIIGTLRNNYQSAASKIFLSENAAQIFESAIQTAIDSISKKGGGKVIVPQGTYFCAGSIFLKDNVNLHLEENAVIKFSTNPDDYLPVVLTGWRFRLQILCLIFYWIVKNVWNNVVITKSTFDIRCLIYF